MINIPGIPQYEALDFFMFLKNLPISMGEVFKMFNSGIPFNFSSSGAGSLEQATVDFDAKNELSMLLFCKGSLIVSLFSTRGGIVENFEFFISFTKILNFFLADIEKLFIVLFIV